MRSLLLGLTLSATSDTARAYDVSSRVWRPSQDDFAYPEVAADTGIPHLDGRDDFGVAFAGGGLRGMSLAHGATRALRESGLLSRARYYTVSSGSTWFGLPLYFQTQDTLDEFLGISLPPEQLTPEVLVGPAAGTAVSRLTWPITQFPGGEVPLAVDEQESMIRFGFPVIILAGLPPFLGSCIHDFLHDLERLHAGLGKLTSRFIHQLTDDSQNVDVSRGPLQFLWNMIKKTAHALVGLEEALRKLFVRLIQGLLSIIEQELDKIEHQIGDFFRDLLHKIENFPGNFVHCLSNFCSCFTDLFMPSHSMHLLWLRVTGLITRPFGLNKAFSHYTHASREEETRAQLAHWNLAHLYVSQDVKHELPFLISQAAVFSLHSGYTRWNKLKAFTIENSALYTGLPVSFNEQVGKEHFNGGDVLTEPFAASSELLEAPDWLTETGKVHVHVRINDDNKDVGGLVEWQGVTTCALGAWQIRPWAVRLAGLLPCTAEVGEQLMPHHSVWSPLDINVTTKLPISRAVPVGDAGVYDDLGHLPLLRRGVKKLAIYASAAQVDGGVTLEANVYVKAAFGAPGGLTPPNPAGAPNPQMEEGFLTVFEPSEFAAFWEQAEAKLAAGEPPVIRGTYTVVDNPNFGIVGGWQCEVVWVLMLPSATFRSALPSRTEQALPVYFPSFGAAEPRSHLELSTLSQYASWLTETVAAGEIRAMLDGVDAGVSSEVLV